MSSISTAYDCDCIYFIRKLSYVSLLYSFVIIFVAHKFILVLLAFPTVFVGIFRRKDWYLHLKLILNTVFSLEINQLRIIFLTSFWFSFICSIFRSFKLFKMYLENDWHGVYQFIISKIIIRILFDFSIIFCF